MIHDPNGQEPFSPQNRTIDFETIRRQKEKEKKLRRRLVWVGIGVLVVAVIGIIVYQLVQVADESRDFWSNFSAWYGIFPQIAPLEIWIVQ